MTSRERMKVAFSNRQADMVPVCPDTSNMIPCRLTGKPFWDIYLYQDPPLWRAYTDCVKFFGFDGWPHVYVELPEMLSDDQLEWRSRRGAAIIRREPDRLWVQGYTRENGRRQWDGHVTCYPIADPPWGMPLRRAHLPAEPESWEEVEGVHPQPTGREFWKANCDYAGESGIPGAVVGLYGLPQTEEGIYRYFDDYPAVKREAQQAVESAVAFTERLLTLDPVPDHIMVGNSGIMTYEGPEIFRDISLPVLQAVTALCKKHGVLTHLHACGKEYELVKMAAQESDLDSIEPLEPPPMGDCDLAQLKREFGSRIALKGNLHTTDVMLRGTPEEVERAAKWCIDVAAEGGGYVLSTGDQCGRDTPDENLRTLVEVARTYGRY